MEWQIIVALVVMLPVILLPAAFVWYMNIGGMAAAFREARKRKAARKEAPDKVTAAQKVVK